MIGHTIARILPIKSGLPTRDGLGGAGPRDARSGNAIVTCQAESAGKNSYVARIKPEEIVDDLSSEFRGALEDAVLEVLPNAQFDRHALFRAFKRAVRRKCSSWARVSDSHVEKD